MENAGLQSRALAEIFRFQQQLLSAEQPQDGVGDDPTAIRSTVSPTATATVTIKDGLALNVFNVDTNSNAAAAATSVVPGEVKTEIPEEKPSPMKLTGSSKRKRAAPRKLVDELPMRVLEGGGGDVATAAAGSAGLDLGGVKTEEGGDEPAETTCQQLNAVKHEVDEEGEEDGGKGVDAAAAAARTAAEAVDLFQRLGQMLSSGTAVQNALHAMLAGADGSNGSAAAALLPFLQGGGAGGDTTSSTGDMHNLMQAAALAAANQFGGNMLMTPNGGGGQPAALKRPGKGSDFEMYMNASASTSAAAAAAALPKPAGNKSGLKRKLFDGDKEAMKAAAASITREERIDLDDLEAFAQQFKKQRIKFGFTQGDVGTALGRRYGTDFSQTTISRFEALNLSFKNMCKLRPLLKEWLSDAEAALAGGATLNDLLERGTPRQNNYPGLDPALMPVVNSGVAAAAQAVGAPLKKRRKRTNLDMTQRTALDAYFRLNSRPDHDKMNEISELLELDRDVVRVWFCNRRQKMRKVEDTGSEARVDSAMLDQLFGGGGGGGGSRSSQPGSAASSTSATPVPPRSDSPGGGGEEQPQPVQVALGLGLAGLGGVGGLAGAAAAAGNILKDE